VLTGAEVESSTIPEAVPVEGVVPETEVATEAATEPAEIAAPGVAEDHVWFEDRWMVASLCDE
jgi:hypothetical protein